MKSPFFKHVEVVGTHKGWHVIKFKDKYSLRDDHFFSPFEMGVAFDTPEEATDYFDRQQFQDTIDRATKLVSSWPLWKQNILQHSSEATRPRREPVINDHAIYD